MMQHSRLTAVLRYLRNHRVLGLLYAGSVAAVTGTLSKLAVRRIDRSALPVRLSDRLRVLAAPYGASIGPCWRVACLTAGLSLCRNGAACRSASDSVPPRMNGPVTSIVTAHFASRACSALTYWAGCAIPNAIRRRVNRYCCTLFDRSSL